MAARTAARKRHPSRYKTAPSARTSATASRDGRGRGRPGSLTKSDSSSLIPRDTDNITLNIDGKTVKLTNLRKPFWPKENITKGDLLRYYVDVAHVLLPHIQDRAMVMKRYPNGIDGAFFFMKRAPSPRPDWLTICSIKHPSANVIDFPVINDLAALLWVVNLGCIDLNQWYARCDDVDRPDYLHFDLDPVKGGREATFNTVLKAAMIVRDALESIKMPCYAKTTGSRGVHIYVPIVRGPTQQQVWDFAKAFSHTVARTDQKILTAVYAVSRRPQGRVLVDYNQNAWGRTLASVYSVRPRPKATVSAPITWKGVERGVSMEDFTIETMPARIKKVGDLFDPLLSNRGRFNLESLL